MNILPDGLLMFQFVPEHLSYFLHILSPEEQDKFVDSVTSHFIVKVIYRWKCRH